MKTIGYSFQGLTGKAFELLSKYIQEELFKLGGHWAGMKNDPVNWNMTYIYFCFADKRLTYSSSITPDTTTQREIEKGGTIICTDVDKFLQAIKDHKKPFEVGDWIYITESGGGTSSKDVVASKPEIKVGMFVTCKRSLSNTIDYPGAGFEEGKVFFVDSVAKSDDPIAFPPKIYTTLGTHGVFVSQLVPSTEKEIDTYLRKLITDHNIKKGDLIYSAIDGDKYEFGDDNFDLAVETSTGDLRVSIEFHNPISSFWIVGNGKLSQTFFEAPFSKSLTSTFQEWDVRTKGNLIAIGCKSFTKDEAKAIGKFIRELGINSIESDETSMDVDDIESIMEIIDEYTK